MDSTESRDLLVEQILSEAASQGPEDAQVILASSAAALTNAITAIRWGLDIAVVNELGSSVEVPVEVPNLGNGTCLAAFWGTRPTTGYSVVVESASLEGDQVRVHLALLLDESFRGEMLTYPFAVALIRDVNPNERNFSFEAFVENLEWWQQVVN